MDSLCRVRNTIMYVLSWRTVSALTRVLFWYLFPSLLRNSRNKHQNNPIVSAETIRHSSHTLFSISSDSIRHFIMFILLFHVCYNGRCKLFEMNLLLLVSNKRNWCEIFMSYNIRGMCFVRNLSNPVVRVYLFILNSPIKWVQLSLNPFYEMVTLVTGSMMTI